MRITDTLPRQDGHSPSGGNGWAFAHRVSDDSIQVFGENSTCRDFMGSAVYTNAVTPFLDEDRTRLVYRAPTGGYKNLERRLPKLHRIEAAFGFTLTEIQPIEGTSDYIYIDADQIFQTSSQLLSAWTCIIRMLVNGEKFSSKSASKDVFDWIAAGTCGDGGMLQSTLKIKVNGKSMLHHFFESPECFSAKASIAFDHPHNDLKIKHKIGGGGGFWTMAEWANRAFNTNKTETRVDIYIAAPLLFLAKKYKLEHKIIIPTQVFVYGTLMTGESNNRVMQAAGGKFLASWCITGGYRLWSLGAYPGVTVDATKHNRITGELWEVNDLSPLDRLEGYPSFYGRTEVRTNVGKGTALMYTLSKDYPTRYKLEEIKSGSWLQHVGRLPKTFKERLKEEHPYLFNLLMSELKKYRDEGKTFSTLDNALDWGATSQGYDFWAKKHLEFKQTGFYKTGVHGNYI
jgi:gamma-glutamylcyclotransferase (GGCT)/AIG2-like uncharacterized protein YtfP